VLGVRPVTTNVKIFPTAVYVMNGVVGLVVVPYRREKLGSGTPKTLLES
jgi:hypothetical protein